MTSEELERYGIANRALEGAKSAVPLPFFYEIGKNNRWGGWLIPIEIEVNVVSIVMRGSGMPDVGWTPKKAEPFKTILWVQMYQSGGTWAADTKHVEVINRAYAACANLCLLRRETFGG
jgi:hypothetical protein